MACLIINQVFARIFQRILALYSLPIVFEKNGQRILRSADPS